MGNTRLPLRHETIVHNPKALRVSPSSAPFCPAAELISSAGSFPSLLSHRFALLPASQPAPFPSALPAYGCGAPQQNPSTPLNMHRGRVIARNRPRTSRSRLDSSGYRVKSELADASCIDPLYAFVNRTRTDQKISIISGSMLRIKYNVVLNRAGDRCCPSPTAVSNLRGRFDGPRKKDPAAMNSPKHMRQRCRAMRFFPRTPPRTSMRRSPAPASSITEPMKKVIPTGTPSCELAPLRTTFRPFVQVRIPSAKGIRSTTQSKPLVSPSLRLAVSHAVPMR